MAAGRTGSSWFGPALGALRLYWPAVVGLQVCAGLAALGYYHWADFRGAADALAAWKESGGVWFVMAANVISGGVIPEVIKTFLRPPGRPAPTPGALVHLFVMLALTGWMVDSFYRLQGFLFGSGTEFWRVALKIAVDQFGFSLLVAVPFILVWFAWRECGYSPVALAAVLRRGFFKEKVPQLFAPNFVFWVPSLMALYSLPTELQFVLFLFLNAAWCLVMVFIAREVQRQ